MDSGRLVTFEGIEGAGKSTQVSRVAERLRARGWVPLTTREPGGTPLGESLRSLLLAGQPGGLDPLVEALLMVADRAEHVIRVLRPALAEGRVVLCDRHADATLAYQGGGSGLDLSQLQEWNRAATSGRSPDLTVLLDLPPELAQRRLRARGVAGPRDRFESESSAFFERVRAVYLDLARAEPRRWLVLDATEEPESLTNAIEAEILRRLPKNLTPGGSGRPGAEGSLC